MRILAVSVAPLFPDRIMGGSQRILLEVVDALSNAGHDVRLLCSQVDDNEAFDTAAGVPVLPVLQLRGSFPAQYQTAPHRLNRVWNVLAEHAAWADRAYLHADAIYMRDALGDLPVIRALHDYVYEEALLSAFTLPADRTVVPSQYVADCISASAGQVADVGELRVVPNGIDSPGWPVSSRLPNGVEPRRDNDVILLHPHRLQPGKGVKESMQIAVELQRRLSDQRVRLLVPGLQPNGSNDDAVLAQESVAELARSLGADDLVELHPWLSPEQMPGYLAAGDVTLCPGSFVEAFGLVPLESVVAETPAVCARVGAFRDQADLPGIRQFDYGDTDAAVDAVIEALNDQVDRNLAARNIVERFHIDGMREGYIKAIAGRLRPVSKRSPAQDTGGGTALKLAPWCYVSGDRIYHDYLARFEKFPRLTQSLNRDREVSGSLEAGDRLTSEIEKARSQGFVVSG